MLQILNIIHILVDPADGVKGRTWGPSSVKNERHQRTSVIFADGRWSKSAPNLERSLKNLGHSNTGALNSLCKSLSDTYKRVGYFCKKICRLFYKQRTKFS